MKTLLRKILPNYLLQNLKKLRLIRRLDSFIKYDRQRLIEHSFTFCSNEASLQAKIILHYHVLEKGLVMPDFRPCYGRTRVKELMHLMQDYVSCGYNCNHSQFVSAIKVLRKYIERHYKIDVQDQKSRELLDQIVSFLEAYEPLVSKVALLSFDGGARRLTGETCKSGGKAEWPIFSESRHTVRDLLNKPVSLDDIHDVIRWACKSPSACNRQSSRVYIVSDLPLINSILNLQGGARGFSQAINKLLVVCSDLSQYDAIMERNQAQIDAGIYAMSLLYGIHYKGLGACLLHWSVEPTRDLELRNLLNEIRPSHSIMCLVGIGHLKEDFLVAYSQRRSMDEIAVDIRVKGK